MTTNERIPLWGIRLFGWGLIITSIIHMNKLVMEYDFYMDIYSHLNGLAYVRYSFSWLQRIFGISLGIGLLCERKWARVSGMIFGIFVILTVYWKHPYEAFHKHTIILDEKYGDILRQWNPHVTFESLTVPGMVVHWILDIAFWGSFIYYMTRPRVRARFERK